MSICNLKNYNLCRLFLTDLTHLLFLEINSIKLLLRLTHTLQQIIIKLVGFQLRQFHVNWRIIQMNYDEENYDVFLKC